MAITGNDLLKLRRGTTDDDEKKSKISGEDLLQTRKTYQKYQGTDTSAVNDAYIETFVSDANSFLRTHKEDDNAYNKWKDLYTRAETISGYLYKNGSKLDSKSYESIASAIKTFGDETKDYTQFSSEDDFRRYKSGWLDTSAETNERTVADRQKYYSDSVSRAEALDKDLPWYVSGITPNFIENWFLSDEEEDRRDEMERLNAENKQYERGQGVLDKYYKPVTPEFTQAAANRNHINATKEDLWNYDMSVSEGSLALNSGGYFDEYGNIRDSNGTIVQQANAPVINDKLGMFLSASDDDITEAYSRLMGTNGNYTDTWANLMQEGDVNAWRYLKENEIDLYYYYLNTEGQKKAYEYLDAMTTELTRRETQATKEAIEGASVPVQIALNIASVPMNVVGGAAGLIDNVANLAQGKDINPYSRPNSLSNAAGAIREDTAKDIDNATGGLAIPWLDFTLGDAYQAGMSFADSAAAGLIPGGEFLLASGAATSQMKNLYERGASSGQIFAGGTLAYAAEAVFEHYSIGELRKIKNMDEKAVKNFFDGFVRSVVMGGVEASEEMATEIANTISDALVMGSQSEWTDFETFAKNVLNAGLGGFLSGSVGGGVASSINNAQYQQYVKEYGQGIINTGGVGMLQAQAAGITDNKSVSKLSEKVANKQSAKNVGRLAEKVQSVLSAKSKPAAISEMVQNGLTETEAKKVANFVEKVSQGYKATAEEIAEIESITDKLPDVDHADEGIAQASEDTAPTTEVPTAPQAEAVSATENAPVKENAVEGEIKAPADVKQAVVSEAKQMATATMLDGEGNEVSVNPVKFAEIGDGEATLELEGGQTVRADSVEFKNSGVGFVYQAATEMASGVGGFNLDAANVMVRGVSPDISEEDASLYVAAFNEAYRYGAMGYPTSALETRWSTAYLTEDQRTTAYSLGKIYGEGKVSAKQANIDRAKAEAGQKPRKKGKVIFDGSAVGKTLTEMQRASLKGLRVVAEATGVDIHVFESPVGKNGKREGANGWYDPVKKEIHIDLHAGIDGNGLMLMTGSHELTHHIKEVSPAKFKVFADALLEEYTKNGISVDGLVAKKIEQLEKNKRITHDMTDEQKYDLALEEVVADACESMLVDSGAIEALSRKLQAKDKGLWETIKDFITKLVARIRAAYAGVDPDSVEGKLMREMKDSAERLQKLWVEALTDAAEGTTAKAKHEKVMASATGKTGRKKGTVKGEGVTISNLKKTFNDTQNTAYKILSTIAEATGVDIVLYKSETNDKGDFEGAQGKYDRKDDKIYIDINAGLTNIKDVNDLAKYAMLRTFSHEFTHFLEKWNPEWYNEFRKVVFETLTERGEDVNDLIEAKQAQNPGMDYDKASREVVAEAMTDILPDSHFIETLVNQHKNIFDKLLDKLKEFLADLKSYFKTIGHNPSREANALKEQVGEAVRYVDNIVKMFDEGAAAAVDNYQMTVATDETTEISENKEKTSHSQEKKEVTEYATQRTETEERSDEAYSGTNPTHEGSRKETFGKNGNGPRVPETVGETGRGFQQDRSSERHHQDEVDFLFDRKNDLSPEKNSPLYNAKKAVTEEYGMECYVLKAAAWKRKNPACACDGRIYLSEDIDPYTLATFVPHETTHGINQKEFQPYQDFIDNTLEFINFTSEYANRLFKMISEHVGYNIVDIDDSIDEKTANALLSNFYDELNASVYGFQQGGIIDDPELDYGWIPGAFHDFDAYIRELSDIHEQFKAEIRAKKSESATVEAENYDLNKAYAKENNLKLKFSDRDVQKSFGIRSINDYVGVQKAVINTLTNEGFFSEKNNVAINKDSGMVVEITKDGIRETLGPKNRFQTLPRDLKELKLSTIRRLPYLIENAHLDSDNVINMHNAESKVKYAYLSIDINTEQETKEHAYTVTITVRKSPEKNKFWIHEIRTTKKEQGLSSSGDIHPRQEYNKTLTLQNIISQDTDFVNHKFSDRQTDSFSNRSLLAGALETAVQNDIERTKLEQYKQKIDLINSEEQKLRDLRAQIKKLSFEKGPRDTEALKNLQFEANQTANRINVYDRQLLDLESTKALKGVLEREKKLAYQKAEQRGKEALEAQRERDRKALVRYRDKRQKTEIRQRTRSTVHRLNTLLKGGKKRNVKEELRNTVSTSLDLAELIFSDDIRNEDIARLGADSATESERKLLNEYKTLILRRDGCIKEINDAFERKANEDTLTELAEKIEKGEVTDISKIAEELQRLEDPEFSKIAKKLGKTKETALEAIREKLKDSKDRVFFDISGKLKEIQKQISLLDKKLSGLFKRERERLYRTTADQLLDTLANEYRKLKNSDQPYIRAAYDEMIEKRLVALKDSFRDTTENESDKETSVKDMSVFQLEEIYDAYRMVTHFIQKADKAFKAENEKGVSDMAEQVMADMKRSKQKRLITKFGKAADSFRWNNLKPLYAFERFGSSVLSKLFGNIRAGEDTWAVDISEAKKFFEEQQSKFHYEKFDFEKKYQFRSSTGKDFELTLGQIMSLYAYSKRGAQAIEHLEFGGFKYDEHTKIKRKNKLGINTAYEINDSQTYMLGNGVLEEIIKVLDDLPNEKSFVDAMQDYLSTVMGDKGNEISLALYGVKLFKEKNYFPLKTAHEFHERAREQASQTAKIKNKGFTKETAEHSHSPIVLSSFMDVWAGHVNEMSMYHAFALPLEDFYRVYNYQTGASDSELNTKGVIPSIEGVHGKAAIDYIDQLLKDLNGGARSDPREIPFKALTSNFKKAAVMASLSVVVQQPSAIVRAYALIDARHFVGKKVSKAKQKETWEEVKKYAPVAIIKEMGYFDTGMGKSSVDWLKGEKTWKDKVDDVLSFLPSKADELTWCAIWNAVKRETARRNPDMATSSEEFLKLAGERFTEVITKTQVYDSTLAKSANMRSKNLYMNMLTAFMAEPTTSINMLQDAFRKGGKKRIARAMGAVYGSVLLNSVLVSLVYAARDDDEDETYLEKYLSSLVTEVVDGLNPLTYLPFVKDIWSIAQGFDIERADMTLIDSLIDSFKQLFTVCSKDTDDMDEEELGAHRESVAGAILSVVDNGASLLGIPEKNLRREIGGAINFIKTLANESGKMSAGSLGDNIVEDLKDSVPVWGWFPDKSKSDKLYDAIVKGDEKYSDRLMSGYKDQSAVNSALRKALRDNDPRIKEAAEARYNGDIAEYMKIAKSIIAEGNFKQDDVVAAVNSEINEIKKRNGDVEESAPSDKVVSLYKVDDYFKAIMGGDSASAYAVKYDLIETSIANGKDRDEAEASFNSSLTKHIQDQFKKGAIAEYEAKNMLSYAGKTAEEAAEKVQFWRFRKQYPDYDLTESQVTNYYDKVYSSGVSVGVYYDYCKKRAGAKGTDSDGDGKTDSGSVKREVLQIIHSLPISSYQKDALYYLNGWSASTIWEAPWH